MLNKESLYRIHDDLQWIAVIDKHCTFCKSSNLQKFTSIDKDHFFALVSLSYLFEDKQIIRNLNVYLCNDCGKPSIYEDVEPK